MELGLAAVGVVVALIALVPTTLAWWEARRHRLQSAPAAPARGATVTMDSPHWRCGIYDYNPLSNISADNPTEANGPLVELAQCLSAKIGKTIEFVPFSYRDFFRGETGLPDMVMGMFETRRRADHMAFSRPIYEIGLQGICRIDQSGDLLEGIREGPLKVAVYLGEVGWEFVHDELPDAVEQHRVAELGGGRQLDTMGLLTQGSYDAVIMDELACCNFLRQGENATRFKLAFSTPPKTFEACVAVRRRHQAVLPELNAVLEAVRNEADFLERERGALTGFETVIARRMLRAKRQRT